MINALSLEARPRSEPTDLAKAKEAGQAAHHAKAQKTIDKLKAQHDRLKKREKLKEQWKEHTKRLAEKYQKGSAESGNAMVEDAKSPSTQSATQ